MIDTLSASCGEGCLVDKAVELRDSGLTLEETAKWIEDNKLNLHHWYTVDDLHFLQRGGRVSASAAWFGSTLRIKPVMNMDNAGHLIPREKVIGRKRSISGLAHKLKVHGDPQKNKKIFISHGDCLDEVMMLVEMIKKEWGEREFVISYVGNGEAELIGDDIYSFLQREDALTQGNDVSGLGLAISRAIIDSLDGDLDIDTHSGRKTIVTVWFPCKMTNKHK